MVNISRENRELEKQQIFYRTKMEWHFIFVLIPAIWYQKWSTCLSIWVLIATFQNLLLQFLVILDDFSPSYDQKSRQYRHWVFRHHILPQNMRLLVCLGLRLPSFGQFKVVRRVNRETWFFGFGALWRLEKNWKYVWSLQIQKI